MHYQQSAIDNINNASGSGFHPRPPPSQQQPLQHPQPAQSQSSPFQHSLQLQREDRDRDRERRSAEHSATHSQVPSPTQTHVHPTDDAIEAIIQQATAARSGDSRPLRDTRTQLFVGNVRSVYYFLVQCSHSFPFSSPTASAGKTSKTSSERLALSSAPTSPSGLIIAPEGTGLCYSLRRKMRVGQWSCLVDTCGRRGCWRLDWIGWLGKGCGGI